MANRWRQKTGLLTLFLALVIASAWGRGQFVEDAAEFTIPISESVKYVVWLTPNSTRLFRHTKSNDEQRMMTEMRRVVEAPYWAMITPLIAVSVYLLLIKPRVSEHLS